MALRLAGYRNGYLIKSTGQVIAFIRKRDEFKVNRIVQYVPSDNPTGVYHRIHRDNGIRIDNMNKRLWRDGAMRPEGVSNVLFDDVPFSLNRWCEPWTIGYQAIDNFEHFDLKVVHIDQAVSQIMTDLSYRVYNTLLTDSNWGGVNVKTAKQLNGGNFLDKASAEEGNPAHNAIKKTLFNAANNINLATNGKVKPTDLIWCMSPGAALKLGATGEMTNYVKGSPDALKIQKEGIDNPNAQWFMPATFQGFEVMVIDDVGVNERQKADGSEATTNRAYLWDDNTSVLIPKPKSLDGSYGKMSYSLLQVYYYKKPIKGESSMEGQAVVRAYPDDLNQVLKGDVTMQTGEYLTAPVAGHKINSMFS